MNIFRENIDSVDKFGTAPVMNHIELWYNNQHALPKPEELSDYWWISFCDTNQPTGQHFICIWITTGHYMEDAVERAWPHSEGYSGLETACLPITHDSLSRIPEQYRDRRLSLDEVREFDDTVTTIGEIEDAT